MSIDSAVITARMKTICTTFVVLVTVVAEAAVAGGLRARWSRS